MNLLKYLCCYKKFLFYEDSIINDNKKNDKNINNKLDDKDKQTKLYEEEVINLDDDMNKLLDKQPKNKDYLKKDDKIYLKNIKDKLYETDKHDYFSFVGKTFYARPCNIYDGDTFSIIFLHNNNVIKYRCRCIDYDSSEMKPLLSNPNRDNEKALAILAKNRFTELLTKHESGLVFVECFEFDKYGRILVRVYNMIDTKSINEIMVEEGHGKNYDGGKKDTNW